LRMSTSARLTRFGATSMVRRFHGWHTTFRLSMTAAVECSSFTAPSNRQTLAARG
jgi:hypothetical protein